ncbi:MAG: hypothetical protein Kow0080_11560 [Candidatus Promineifilaceae bacterium]
MVYDFVLPNGNVCLLREAAPTDKRPLFTAGLTFSEWPVYEPYFEQMMHWQVNGRCLWLIVEPANTAHPIASGQLIYYPHTAEIANIIVHPHWQRQGIGQTLVTRLLITASQQQTPFIETRVETDNSPALALYTKLGFTENGRVTLNQTPVIILHKKLTPNN